MSYILYFCKNHVKDILIGLLSLIIIGLSIFCYLIYNQNNNEAATEISLVEENTKEDKVEEDQTTEMINVDVKGAVKKPGVYQVAKKAIINEVITLAGGFNSNAYKNGINLSKKVVDEMVIYVYTKAEIEAKNKASETTTQIEVEASSICEVPSYNICECVEDTKSIVITEESSNLPTSDNLNQTTTSLININTATVVELTTLSGIGEARAKAIIEYREKNGNFKTIEELKNVSGIGEASFEKIKDYITV